MDSEKSESAAGRCRREQSVSDSKREALHTVECGATVWSVAEQQLGAWLLFPAESAAAQPTAVVRLALVRAQSTLCSSKRQSAILPPWLT